MTTGSVLVRHASDRAGLFTSPSAPQPVASNANAQLVEFSSGSVRTGAKAVRLTGDNLVGAANDYANTDGFIGSVFTPR